MPCPQCQHENPEGLTFCNQCGTPLSGHCAECGFTNQPGSKFCGACGTSLTGHSPHTTDSHLTQRETASASRFHAMLRAVSEVGSRG